MNNSTTSKKLFRSIRVSLCLIVLVGIDQWTKWLAVEYLLPGGPIPLIKDVFELQYLENRGMAFGLLQNKSILFIVMTVIVLGIIGYIYDKLPEDKKYHPLRVIMLFIAAGALGNFMDRVFNGYVVDFLYFKLIDFPIFNVADIYVTCSAILLIILILFYYKDEDFSFLSSKNREVR